ncbi:unnamed protein product [Amoebophrya sp. A120]|nr:unnamed protein product [Amoebophrya sp. A120]|eukprot:GSA120T00014756001.1
MTPHSVATLEIVTSERVISLMYILSLKLSQEFSFGIDKGSESSYIYSTRKMNKMKRGLSVVDDDIIQDQHVISCVKTRSPTNSPEPSKFCIVREWSTRFTSCRA